LVWAELKRFLRKKLLKSKQEIANRVQKFFDEILTVEKCQTYIGRVNEVSKRKIRVNIKFKYFLLINFHIFKVLRKVIERNGDWTDF